MPQVNGLCHQIVPPSDTSLSYRVVCHLPWRPADYNFGGSHAPLAPRFDNLLEHVTHRIWKSMVLRITVLS